MSKKIYQICTETIMDTGDTEITFDEQGRSNHFHTFHERLNKKWFPNELGAKKLDALVAKMKKDGKGKEYDAIIGLSGGVDSSYLAYLAKTKYNLRVLAVHVDGGWNSKLATQNIENIIKILDIDLFTHVVNWREMQDLQLSYFKASVLNQDVPQDHAFVGALFAAAKKFKIQYFLGGHNYATESCLNSSYTTRSLDLMNLEDIHKKYGKVKLKTFPKSGFFKSYIYYPHIYKLKIINMLNYMPFKKSEAMKLLEEKLDWEYYGGKHFESRFTKFFQTYYLPKKFGVDKRRSHLSSLILNGEITRDEALQEIEKPLYDENTIEADIKYIAKKLGISKDEFIEILETPPKSHKEYASDEKFYNFVYNNVKRLGFLKYLIKR